MIATTQRPPFEAPVSGVADELTGSAAFEAFFAAWFPRVYRFAAARLPDRRAAEAATRAALEAAVRGGAVGDDGASAARLLGLLQAEIARAGGAHGFVTRKPRPSQ